MRVDAAADIGIAADARHAEPFQQRQAVRPGNLVDREMRQVDDAAILAQRQMLGVRDAPEMPRVPFVRPFRHPVAVFRQQVVVRGIAMRALPAADLHEIPAQFDLALVEGRAADIAPGLERLARVDGGVIGFLGRFVAAAVNEISLKLMRMETGIVDPVHIDRCPAVGDPVRQDLAEARRIAHPDRHRIPQAAHLLAFPDRGHAAVRRHLQRPVEGSRLVIAELRQDRRQLHRALQGP